MSSSDVNDMKESLGFAKRVFLTLLCLVVFRLGVHVPCPGVNAKALVIVAEQRGSGILRLLNTFSGGALEHFSVFALGVMPYISASIIVQLLGVVVPTFEQWQKEGGSGRSKINSFTRYLAVLISIVQGFMLALGLEASPETVVGPAVLYPGFAFKVLSALFLTCGTCFVMWLGEQIGEKGLGNGVSIIIFAGIVAYLPRHASQLVLLLSDSSSSFLVVALFLGLVLLLLGFVSLFEQSYRKVPIHYSRSLRGGASAVQSSHLPLKVNMAGVIPSIFASTVLMLPVSFVSTSDSGSSRYHFFKLLLADFSPFHWLYNCFFVILVVFFCFFYTSVTFKPEDVAENLKRQSAFIPGIRPGTETASAISSVVSNITLAGAIYMSMVVLLPVAFSSAVGVNEFVFSGTSMLIVVGVSLELMRQTQTIFNSKNYDSLFWQ